jgi:alkylation response protein AidB-like acyl-CoA dehydrogenase
MLVDAIGRFAASDLRPAAQAADQSTSFPQDVTEKGWRLGLVQGSLPETLGGLGARSAVTSVLALEELCFGDLAGALAILTPSLLTTPLLLAGSENQKSAHLGAASRELRPAYTAAFIEYAFDFDPNDMRTIAHISGDAYVLSGEKALVPFAADAELMLVYAAFDGRTQGFIVPRTAAGLTVASEREQLLGLNALPLYRIVLKDVRVPIANRLGGAQGHDFSPILASMHIGSAAAALGLARAAFEYSRDYAMQREAFGMKIAQKQAVAFMLAEMRTEIEGIRLLTWEAAWKLDEGKSDASVAAYLAATGAADMAMMVTDRALQILGGHGYLRDHPIEMWMRNGRGIAMLTGLAIA